MKNNLGIYFGVKGIEVVWAKGRKILANFDIPQEKYTTLELEEKVPQEIKIVALIKDGLRKQRIESKEANLCLCGRDLIIRSFELPVHLPPKELPQAVSYEVKKYLPFKLEEIFFDFQAKKDYKEKKTLVIFLGIKKENFNFYLSLMKELGFKLNAMEYSGFSLLRFAKILNLAKKGTFAFLNLDFEDESSFIVIEDNFPLFTRDIYLEKETDRESQQSRLKSEIQLSLDYYYHRKFPSKHIEKIIIFGPMEVKDIVIKLNQEMDWNLEFMEVSQKITHTDKYSLSALKALGGCLKGLVSLPYSFDLKETWEREGKKEEKKEIPSKITLQEFKPSVGVVILCIFMLIFSFGWQFYQRIPIKKQIDKIISEQRNINPVLGGKTHLELENKKSEYYNKLNTIKNVVNQYHYLLPSLNLIPQILPEGVWLVELNFIQRETKRELYLKGKAYLKDYNKELSAINKFFSDLKNNPEFSKAYKNIELVSIERSEIEKKEVTDFAINCW